MDRAGLWCLVAAVALTVVLSGCEADRQTSLSTSCRGKETLIASGSSAQAIAMERFIAAYEKACPGHSLRYTSNGSGAGVAGFLAGRIDFAGTDSPIIRGSAEWVAAVERCGGTEPWNLPLAFGPIAITYNVFGVDSLVLDGPTIAKIFRGRLTSWDAPEIVALNPDVDLPPQPIVVLYRGDESGTTDNFQRYLQATAGDAWGRGAGKAFRGGVGWARQGNEGTSAAIPRTPGSITYTEWSFAQKQQLPSAQIVNRAGSEPVTLSADSAASSVAGIAVIGQGNDLLLDIAALYQPTRREAYPIMLATYEVVCSKYPDRATAEAVREFVGAAMSDGQLELADVGYVPLPDSLIGRLKQAVGSIAWAEDWK